MSKTGTTDFSCKKAFELSYALFRIAAIAKSRSFAGILEEKATLLLNSILSDDYESTRAILEHVDYFMRLGADAGLIHIQNAEIVIKESNALYTAIAGLPEPAKLQELNLGKIFSKSVLQDKISIPATIPAKRTKIPAKSELQEREEIAGMVKPDNNEIELQDSDDINPAKSELRQSAIANKLQETGSCRFGELQELLPEISERTLRYDIQSLIDKGVIERIGGGKNSFYQFRAQTPPVIELPGVSSFVQ